MSNILSGHENLPQGTNSNSVSNTIPKEIRNKIENAANNNFNYREFKNSFIMGAYFGYSLSQPIVNAGRSKEEPLTKEMLENWTTKELIEAVIGYDNLLQASRKLTLRRSVQGLVILFKSFIRLNLLDIGRLEQSRSMR